jgi:hypothetical protein
MIEFMWKLYPEWMTSYMAGKTGEGDSSLERMVQRLANQ